MIAATTTKSTHKHADQHAAGKETTAARKPPQHDTEHDAEQGEQTGQEGSRRYRWDDPEIQALAAKGGVPDAALAARLGRMLGLARKP